MQLIGLKHHPNLGLAVKMIFRGHFTVKKSISVGIRENMAFHSVLIRPMIEHFFSMESLLMTTFYSHT